MRKLIVTILVSAGVLLGAGAVAAQAQTTPPTATISSPASGGTYAQGQSVATKFSCADPAGSGVQSCRDSNGVTSGAGHLDTSKAGAGTYTVTAVANDGLTGAASISYTVVDCGTAFNQGYNKGFNSGYQSGFQSEFRAAYRPNGGWQLGWKSGFATARRKLVGGKLVGGYTVRHAALAAGPAATPAPPVPTVCNTAFNTGFNQAFNVGFNRGFNGAFNSAFRNGYSAGLKAGGVR